MLQRSFVAERRGKPGSVANSRLGSGMGDGLAGYLKTRRSIPANQITEPGPDAETLRAILGIAARVPDHGKLAPWRFILYDRENREAAIAGLVRIAESQTDERERRYRADKSRGFAEAPLVIGVVSSPDPEHPKVPLWEQQLSAGAVCLNLIHAAQAHGFAAQWLTGWYAYDEAAACWLGVRSGERVAGFVYVGTPAAAPVERDRPDLDAITTRWAPTRQDLS